MAIRAIIVAKLRGNSVKMKKLMEFGIGNISFKFFWAYWLETSTKKIKARIINAGISVGICSTNLNARMYRLPPPARRML